MSKYLTLENIKNAEVGDRLWLHLKIEPVSIFPAINRDISIRLIKKDNGEAIFDQTDILFLLYKKFDMFELTEYVNTRISQAIPLKNKAFILDLEQYLKLPVDWTIKYYQQRAYNFLLSRENSLVLNDFPLYSFSDFFGLSFSFCVNFKSMKYSLE